MLPRKSESCDAITPDYPPGSESARHVHGVRGKRPMKQALARGSVFISALCSSPSSAAFEACVICERACVFSEREGLITAASISRNLGDAAPVTLGHDKRSDIISPSPTSSLAIAATLGDERDESPYETNLRPPNDCSLKELAIQRLLLCFPNENGQRVRAKKRGTRAHCAVEAISITNLRVASLFNSYYSLV